MKTRTIAAVLAVAGLWTAGITGLSASDPIGLYAVIDKIVVEPAQGQAQTIQIWGTFALADTTNKDDYGVAQKGYLYYSCPASQEATCKNEWSDLQSVAGKGVGVGFGGRYDRMGRVRAATAKPESPDVYPIRMGVIKMGTRGNQPAIIEKLKAVK